MLEALKKRVYDANMALVEYNLVIFTWGNVSEYDVETGLVGIKPSGVDYNSLKPEDIVLVNLDGEVMEGHYKPSSDTATHIEIYKHFKDVRGVVHTHSPWATSFAQAGKPIKALGTTHADYFYGDIPCTRPMTAAEITDEYEKNTGKVIVETFETINPNEIPGVIVHEHGPFAWGKSPEDAVHNAVVMEEVAKMAYRTQMILASEMNNALQKELLDKHFLRKHGNKAYYGQK